MDRVRDQLCDLWNVPDAPLRLRLEESMRARAERKQAQVTEQLQRRARIDGFRESPPPADWDGVYVAESK